MESVRWMRVFSVFCATLFGFNAVVHALYGAFSLTLGYGLIAASDIIYVVVTKKAAKTKTMILGRPFVLCLVMDICGILILMKNLS